MTKVSVCIPVGPEAHHAAYLSEALQSVAEQTRLPDEVVLVDDMANLTADDLLLLMGNGDIVASGSGVTDGELVPVISVPPSMTDGRFALELLRPVEETSPVPYRRLGGRDYKPFARIWRAPWRLGVAAAFNAGVGIAKGDLVFMLGADDRLLPDCLERCAKAYERQVPSGRQDRYYWSGVQYSDGRPDQYLPCNAAAVTKGLWRLTGGFPPETGSGAPDAALVSILSVHHPGLLVCIDERAPQYWYRVGDDTDTAQRGPWQSVILSTRDILTKTWQRPSWGRFE